MLQLGDLRMSRVGGLTPPSLKLLTAKVPQKKIGPFTPKRKGECMYSKHPFSGAFAVSFREGFKGKVLDIILIYFNTQKGIK